MEIMVYDRNQILGELDIKLHKVCTIWSGSLQRCNGIFSYFSTTEKNANCNIKNLQSTTEQTAEKDKTLFKQKKEKKKKRILEQLVRNETHFYREHT